MILAFIPGEQVMAQLLMATLVLVIGLVLHSLARPFIASDVNRLELFSLLSGTFTLFCGKPCQFCCHICVFTIPTWYVYLCRMPSRCQHPVQHCWTSNYYCCCGDCQHCVHGLWRCKACCGYLGIDLSETEVSAEVPGRACMEGVWPIPVLSHTQEASSTELKRETSGRKVAAALVHDVGSGWSNPCMFIADPLDRGM